MKILIKYLWTRCLIILCLILTNWNIKQLSDKAQQTIDILDIFSYNISCKVILFAGLLEFIIPKLRYLIK